MRTLLIAVVSALLGGVVTSWSQPKGSDELFSYTEMKQIPHELRLSDLCEKMRPDALDKLEQFRDGWRKLSP